MARAIIIAPGDNPALAAFCERRPVPLLSLLDRPFIQHLIEFLASHRIDEYDVVLSHFPELIEEQLGNGERWGVTIRYYLARDPQRPYKPLRSMRYGEGENVLLAHADRLPQVKLDAFAPTAANAPPVLFHSNHQPAAIEETEGTEKQVSWTGWGWVSSESLSRIPADCDEDGLEQQLTSLEGCSRVEVPGMLDIRSYSDFLESNRAVLEKATTGLLLNGREVEDRIWLSRNVILHPTARLTAPVYIAEDCRIGAGARLGPHVVVSKGCIVDAHSIITNSVIFPFSYVGEGLELDGAIVDKNRLINVRLDVAVSVTDDFVLSDVSANSLTRATTRLFSQLLGAVLLVPAAPLLLATAIYLKLFRQGPIWGTQEVVRLPTTMDEATWQTFRLAGFLSADPKRKVEHQSGLSHFFFCTLPGLISVALGRLSFVGVPPRSRETIQRLPKDWRRLYLSAEAGLVTESFVRGGRTQSWEDQYAADTVYAATASCRHDAKLLIGYVARILGWYPNRRPPAAGNANEDDEADRS